VDSKKPICPEVREGRRPGKKEQMKGGGRKKKRALQNMGGKRVKRKKKGQGDFSKNQGPGGDCLKGGGEMERKEGVFGGDQANYCA